jgi:uncharacterized protein involved in outer membrane biogenesis
MKKKILISVLVVLVLLVGVLVLTLSNLGDIIEVSARKFLPKLTESDVQLESVEVRLMKGEASIQGFLIGNPEGYKSASAIQFSEFEIKLDPSSVRSDVIHIHEVLIKDPQITYELGLGNSNIGTLIKNMEKNLASVVKESEAAAEDETDAAPSKKVVIDYVKIEGARVILSSKLTQGVGAPIPLPVIEIKDLGKEKNGIDALIAFTTILKKLSASVFVAVKDLGGAVVEGGVEAAGAVVGGAVDAAGKTVEGAANVAGKTVEGAANVAGKTVEGAAGAAGKVVGGAGEAVGGALNKATGGLKGLLGGKEKESTPENESN